MNEPFRERPHPRRLPAGATVLLLAMLLSVGCGGSGDDAPVEHDGVLSAGAEHDAEMAHAAETRLDENIAATAGEPPVITLDDVSRRVAADSLTRARLERPVAALNSALVRLVELHRVGDEVQAGRPASEAEGRAYRIHLEADTYENDIHGLLTAEQHDRFHDYLVERATAVGLPLDKSHGDGGTGTMGNLFGVANPDDDQHPDTTRTKRNDG